MTKETKKKDKKDESKNKPKTAKKIELDYGELEYITRYTVQDLIERGVLAEDKETHEIDLPEELERKRKKREKEKDKKT